MDSVIYNQEGKEVGKIKLPESVFGVKWNADLVHQVVTSMQTDIRKPYAHTKDRGEVSGGGKKPWQQKGTGRARHGSIRSPIWVGGGVAHGPRNEKNFSRKVNRKMKVKALFTIISQKLRDKELIFLDSLKLQVPKAREAREILAGISKIPGFDKLARKGANILHLAVFKNSKDLARGFGNFPGVTLDEVRNLSPLDALRHKYLLITDPKDSVAFLESKL